MTPLIHTHPKIRLRQRMAKMIPRTWPLAIRALGHSGCVTCGQFVSCRQFESDPRSSAFICGFNAFYRQTRLRGRVLRLLPIQHRHHVFDDPAHVFQCGPGARGQVGRQQDVIEAQQRKIGRGGLGPIDVDRGTK